MISSVTKKVGKKTLKLKLSTRALVRLEAENGGKPFADLMDDLLKGNGGVTLVASVLAAGLDDGKGIDLDGAYDMMDAAGGFRELMPMISEAIGCAFPSMKAALDDEGADVEGAGEAEAGKAKATAEA
ncbi:hypothetical protein [Pseudophaeobacter sp.]|jgi:hypothetical protein|uniref:hypothetical protein n=1 Tax=Pseudophaeobacter sp. TaxID=1971739 RepID=UPI0032D98960